MEEKVTGSSLGMIDSLLNNKRVPKWALGLSVIFFTLAFMLSDLDIGTLLQNKLENDKQIQLQIQSSEAANEAAVITAISDLNKDLNSRMATVLDAYNQQTQINISLAAANNNLVNDVAGLKYTIEQKQTQLNVLRAENDSLQQQINKLTADNQRLADEIKSLNDRIEDVIGGTSQ